mgnify:CR=1 FL=1
MLNYWFAHEEVIRLSIHNAIASSVKLTLVANGVRAKLFSEAGKE